MKWLGSGRERADNPGQHGPWLRKEALGPGPAGNSQLCGSEKILRRWIVPAQGEGKGKEGAGETLEQTPSGGRTEARFHRPGSGSRRSGPGQAAFVLSPE